MIKKLNLNDMQTVKNILDLQVASYRIEAELIGFEEIPPLKDTMDSLKKCGEIFYGCFIENVLAGIISYKISENTLDIHRLAVHPLFFRRGVAEKLLIFLEKAVEDITKIVVCTGKENLPAVNLYLKNGYKKNRDIRIYNHIYLTEFEKIISY